MYINNLKNKRHSINKGNFLKKSKINFFLLEIFFPKNFLNWFIAKISLILQKYFVLRLSKMATNKKKESSWIEQRTVIKVLLAEKCKPCEIYRRMYDVYGEAGFS